MKKMSERRFLHLGIYADDLLRVLYEAGYLDRVKIHGISPNFTTTTEFFSAAEILPNDVRVVEVHAEGVAGAKRIVLGLESDNFPETFKFLGTRRIYNIEPRPKL